MRKLSCLWSARLLKPSRALFSRLAAPPLAWRLNILSFFRFFSIASSLSSGRISSVLGSCALSATSSSLCTRALQVGNGELLRRRRGRCAGGGSHVLRFRSTLILMRTLSMSTSTVSLSPLKQTSTEDALTSTTAASYQRPSLACTAVTSVPGRQLEVSGRLYGRTCTGSRKHATQLLGMRDAAWPARSAVRYFLRVRPREHPGQDELLYAEGAHNRIRTADTHPAPSQFPIPAPSQIPISNSSPPPAPHPSPIK